MAVYQAWGMISSDGFGYYASETNSRFDSEVDAGLRFLERAQAVGVLGKARTALELSSKQDCEQIEDSVWADFHDALPDFENSILGPALAICLQLNR